MKTLAAIKSDLHLLGVPEHQQNRAPSASAFPTKFNQANRSIWGKMFDDADVRSALMTTSDIGEKWDMALVEFMSRCRSASVEPFPTLDTSRNSRIASMLKRMRKEMGLIVDRTGVLKSFRLRNLSRTVVRTDSGFRVLVSMDLIPIKGAAMSDKSDLISGITSPKCKFMLGSGVYRRIVNGAISIQFDTRKSISQFSYELTIAEHPEIESKTSRPVTKAQYEKFVLDKLFLPAVRAYRFETNTQKRSLA
jgi:hypothetical protein